MRILVHIVGILVVVALTLLLLYMTRFWIFTDWWGRKGLFGVMELRPKGNFLTRQLMGTPYQVFSLLLWLCGGFLVLSALQTITTRISARFFDQH
jgi:hypothetical protein